MGDIVFIVHYYSEILLGRLYEDPQPGDELFD